MVIGISSGVGKSTFAKELSETLLINVYHLDALYWKPGWREVSHDEFVAAQKSITCHETEWIIEGNYTSTFDIRAEQADTFIYLELPLMTCLYRVIKRWLKYRGKNRPDMGKDCLEKIDWQFIWFILSTYYPRKRKMGGLLKSFQLESSRNVHILQGRKQIRIFLEDVKLKHQSQSVVQ